MNKTTPGITSETRFEESLLCELWVHSLSSQFERQLCKENGSRNRDINFNLALGCLLFTNYPKALLLILGVRGASWHENLKAPPVI